MSEQIVLTWPIVCVDLTLNGRIGKVVASDTGGTAH